MNVKSSNMGDVLKLTFHVVLKDPLMTDKLVGELSGLEGLHQVSLAYGETAEG